jgi:hypothetical protein
VATFASLHKHRGHRAKLKYSTDKVRYRGARTHLFPSGRPSGRNEASLAAVHAVVSRNGTYAKRSGKPTFPEISKVLAAKQLTTFRQRIAGFMRVIEFPPDVFSAPATGSAKTTAG